MKVLVACEYSGTVRDAFISRGHKAMSCDILPTDRPGPHYQGDVQDLMNEQWDLVIAHPPCTYLSNSGVVWLHRDPSRWSKMKDGAAFFKKMSEFNSPRIVIENPIQHGYAKIEHGLGNPSQVIQPWMFGHPEQKATCLWLYNLPPLQPTNNVRDLMLTLPKKERERLHYLGPSKDRWKMRSQTFSGIAEAMADQWGSL